MNGYWQQLKVNSGNYSEVLWKNAAPKISKTFLYTISGVQFKEIFRLLTEIKRY